MRVTLSGFGKQGSVAVATLHKIDTVGRYKPDVDYRSRIGDGVVHFDRQIDAGMFIRVRTDMPYTKSIDVDVNLGQTEFTLDYNKFLNMAYSYMGIISACHAEETVSSSV